MGPEGSPETSVSRHITPSNNPEGRRRRSYITRVLRILRENFQRFRFDPPSWSPRCPLNVQSRGTSPQSWGSHTEYSNLKSLGVQRSLRDADDSSRGYECMDLYLHPPIRFHGVSLTLCLIDRRVPVHSSCLFCSFNQHQAVFGILRRRQTGNRVDSTCPI